VKETVHVWFAQEVGLLGHRDGSDGNAAFWSQERLDATTIQSASQPEEPSRSPRGHRLDSPVQRLDLQAVDQKTAQLHWRQGCQEEQCPELANTVINCFFTQWFEVWDKRNLDCHGRDYQGGANKLKDIEFREITRLCTFEETFPEDIMLLFQTPLEVCLHWPLFSQRAWISNWEKDFKLQILKFMTVNPKNCHS